jgi:hypothetical protein
MCAIRVDYLIVCRTPRHQAANWNMRYERLVPGTNQVGAAAHIVRRGRMCAMNLPSIFAHMQKAHVCDTHVLGFGCGSASRGTAPCICYACLCVRLQFRNPGLSNAQGGELVGERPVEHCGLCAYPGSKEGKRRIKDNRTSIRGSVLITPERASDYCGESKIKDQEPSVN